MKTILLERPFDVVDFSAADAQVVGQTKSVVQRLHSRLAKEGVAVLLFEIEPRPTVSNVHV